MAICHVQTGDPFNVVCSDNDADRKIRAEACLVPNNDKVCSEEVTKCNAAPFGDGCDENIYLEARKVVCQVPATSFTTGCVNGTHGEVDAARLLACKGEIDDLLNDDAGLCNDEKLSVVICAATGEDANPFAPICERPEATGLINNFVLLDTQRDFCRAGEIGRMECTDTIENFCGRVGSATVGNLFDSLCRDVAYTPERETECRKDIDNGDCTATIANFCGQVGSATVGNLFNSLCRSTDYTPERQTECRGDINNGDCATTIADFCDVASGRDLFDDLCNTGDTAVNYVNYRVAACNVDEANTAVHSTCGDVITNNCPGSPACAPAGETLPASASVWFYTAPNADNTGRLNVLDAV
ncbi:MAG: hypothetical protein K8953_12800, partial [Proteobacteria bacterium]|nr:hypothetical protein [Pseudomonadota bacterium]